jgi:succinyl-CoA synthetase alpha subunit
LVRSTLVRKNRYIDSVFLMLVARRIAAEPGIRDASAVMATDANRKALAAMGYGDEGRDQDFAAAGMNDLVLAIEGEAAAVDSVVARADSYFERGSGPGARVDAPPEPRSIAQAVAERADCSVALISVPGEHAAREARAALSAGLNVFIFSSNVSVDDERALKIAARERGLVVMGPDCGTAYLGGAGIGFANAVRRGPIGIVAASGTGMQEFASLLHRAGSGISSGIGTGSRDLTDAIGGLSTMAGLDALEADPSTKVIALVSKPAGVATSSALAQRLSRCTKPVIACLLGADSSDFGALRPVFSIDEAVCGALRAAGATEPAFLQLDERRIRGQAASEIERMHPRQRYVRGLFAGGTLCYQAQAIFRRSGLTVYSNAPLHGMRELPDPRASLANALVDMGAETFVEGRPHPMIDATERKIRLGNEGSDPSVAVILLDFILGAIASADPVGDLLERMREVRDAARARGRHVCVAASVCGTEDDGQSLQRQVRALEDTGALVFASSAQAATFAREAALLLARRGEGA